MLIPWANLDMKNKDTGVFHGQQQEQNMYTRNNSF